MPDSNPYIEARREWNDRYLELARERRLSPFVAGVELVVLLIVGLGFVWPSLPPKIVPYVVEVDSLGAALAIKPAEPGGHPADERVVRYQLAAFICGARQVMTDRIAMKKGAGACLRLHARACAHHPRRLLRANNPFEIAKTYVIVPTVTSLLRLSPTSWQLRWTEEQRGPDGLLLGKSPVGGRRHHRDRTAALGGRDPDEPLGLYVTDLSWAKQL